MSDLSERLCDAFWAAAEATFNDGTVPGMDMPYFDREMDTVDGHMPHQFWEHMAAWWDKNGKW
jgi:hypothetical protein